MKVSSKMLILILLVLIIGNNLISCTPDDNTYHEVDYGEVEIIGEWKLNENSATPDNRITIKITDDSFVISDESGAVRCLAGVVRYKNDTYNGDETHGSDHGYLMVKFTGGQATFIPNEAIDRYGIIRWRNLRANSNGKTTVDILFAYKHGLLVSHTNNAETAYYDFTNRNGHFGGLPKYQFFGCAKHK